MPTHQPALTEARPEAGRHQPQQNVMACKEDTEPGQTVELRRRKDMPDVVGWLSSRPIQALNEAKTWEHTYACKKPMPSCQAKKLQQHYADGPETRLKNQRRECGRPEKREAVTRGWCVPL